MMVLNLSKTVKIDFVGYQEFMVSKVKLSYVKTTFCGFQKQKNLRKKRKCGNVPRRHNDGIQSRIVTSKNIQSYLEIEENVVVHHVL